MSEIHTIASDHSADACHWPACADPVCARNEAGTCPLSDAEAIVECEVCGAAKALGYACPVCSIATPADAAAEGFYEYPEPSSVSMGEALYPPADPEPRARVQKRSSRPVLIVADDTRIVRHGELRALLEVAGNMKTLGEAIGVDPSTISRALAGSGDELSREQRIEAVRRLLGGEEGS